MFHDYMHDIMEDYVDELLAKSRTHMQYFHILEKVFDRDLEHNVGINPNKCVFGIISGKLLGFIVSKRVIEFDPNKVKAIIDIQPPFYA